MDRLGTIGCALLLVFACAGNAAAQDEADASSEAEGEARMHFRVGRAYYDSGRFPEAAREFQTAYDLSQRPALLYNVFVAHRDAGNLGPAIRALRDYLRLAPDVAEREQLTARLAAMERLAERQGVDVDAAADAAAVEPAASSTAAAQTEVDTSAPAAGASMWLPGWIIAGVGAAAVVAGVVTGALALGEQSTLDAMCDAARTCDPGFESTRDSAALLAGTTDGLLFGGGALVVAGIVLALVVPSGAESAATGSLLCNGHGCVGTANIRF